MKMNNAGVIAEKCIKWIEKKVKELIMKTEENQPYLDGLEVKSSQN
jgi:hypothetical protein